MQLVPKRGEGAVAGLEYATSRTGEAWCYYIDWPDGTTTHGRVRKTRSQAKRDLTSDGLRGLAGYTFGGDRPVRRG